MRQSVRLLSVASSSGLTPLSFSTRSEDATPPHGFSLLHANGSGQFQLVRDKGGCRTIVNCNVSTTVGDVKTSGKALKAHRKTRVGSKPRWATQSTNVNFTCVLSFPPRICAFQLEVLCHALLGQLVVDGVSFHEIPTSFVAGPERSPLQLTYRGPNLSQAHLAEALCNKTRGSSLLCSGRHIDANPFDERENYLASPFQGYGHMPVHTVVPKLTDGVARLLECCRVDDTLADYVQKTAHAVKRQEREFWLTLTKNEFL